MKHYPEQVYNMIEFWMYSGLRTSELFGLRWASVNMKGRALLIHEVNIRGQRKSRTKTKVERTVRLNRRSFAALERQAKHQILEEVFYDPRYRSAWDDELAFRRSYWTPALKALGIPYRRPYNCRHTFASMSLTSGQTPAYTAKQMGHSVAEMLSTYAKWIPGTHDDAERNKLDKFI